MTLSAFLCETTNQDAVAPDLYMCFENYVMILVLNPYTLGKNHAHYTNPEHK
jgi:hypothetical protein